MKHIHQFIFLLIVLSAGFTACEKAAKLPFYGEGSQPQLTASASVVNPPTADSNKVVLALNWTDPGHAQDKSLYKYYLEIDSAGRNFSKATVINVTEDKENRTYSFVAKDLNNILLSYGFEFNVAYDIDIRVVSSYGNNNDQKKSNTVKVKVTPYTPPPKVRLPSSGRLWIIGNVTDKDWDWDFTPDPAIQEFTKVSNTLYEIDLTIQGGGQYKLLPEKGAWGDSYRIDGANSDWEGGLFRQEETYDGAFPGPPDPGTYKFSFDFQQGRYRVVKQ